MFLNLKNAADEYVQNRLASKAHFDIDRNKEKQLKSGSKDPKFLAWVERYTKMFSNDIQARFLRALCEEVENGNVFNYKYNFFEPELPTEEYIRNKAERHEASSRQIAASISQYYEDAARYGRNTGD